MANNIDYLNKIIKVTSLIILSASIYGCSQSEIKTSQVELTESLLTNIKIPTWENISRWYKNN